MAALDVVFRLHNGRVSFHILRQEVERDFFRANEQADYPHGWRVLSVNVPEVKSHSKILYIRGDAHSRDAVEIEMEVSVDIWRQLQDVIQEFNRRYREWMGNNSLENEFFSRARA